MSLIISIFKSQLVYTKVAGRHTVTFHKLSTSHTVRRLQKSFCFVIFDQVSLLYMSDRITVRSIRAIMTNMSTEINRLCPWQSFYSRCNNELVAEDGDQKLIIEKSDIHLT